VYQCGNIEDERNWFKKATCKNKFKFHITVKFVFTHSWREKQHTIQRKSEFWQKKISNVFLVFYMILYSTLLNSSSVYSDRTVATCLNPRVITCDVTLTL